MTPGSNRELATAANDSGSISKGKRKAEVDVSPREAADEPDSELVFEDPFGDDFESDEESGDNSTRQDITSRALFRPGIDEVPDGETLVCEESAYDVLHRMTLEWPALSFDFICLDGDGNYSNTNALPLSSYPLSVNAVAGSQAVSGDSNKLSVLRFSNLHRIRKPGINGEDKDDDDSSSDGDDSSDDDRDDTIFDSEPILQNVDVRFDSVVNRLRCMPQRSSTVAIWGESGRVSLMDLTPALNSLNRDNKKRMQDTTASARPNSIKPLMSFSGHRAQGYALDWSRIVPGRLLTGACNGGIYLWEMSASENGAGKWSVAVDRFRGHRGSVEDLQWSPVEKNVFASCGVDKSIKFWDAREYRKPALFVSAAHSSDVNVISWNRAETHLIASGGDDKKLKVWDLRSLDQKSGNNEASAAAEFCQHKESITSVEWHPRDTSMLAASSEDGTISIWDLAVERDPEEELREGIVLSGADQYPPQLLFIHMGQKNIKELHWHPSCNSLLGSTAEDGMNVFRPANISL